jgi:hypothetical protein
MFYFTAFVSTRLIQQRFFQAGISSALGLIGFGAVSFGAINTAQAASLNLSTWTPVGDVQLNSSQARMSNAFSDGLDDSVNRNLSGANPVTVDALESELSLPQLTLGNDALEGSGLKTVLNGVMAGDTLSFNWSFQTFDPEFIDRAFFAVDNTVFNLNTGNSFSYRFATPGNYRVAFGVIDVDDTTGSSILTVADANIRPIPTPVMIPGLAVVGLKVLKNKRRRTSDLV